MGVSLEVTFDLYFQVVSTGQAFFRSFWGALSKKSCDHFLLSPCMYIMSGIGQGQENHFTGKIQLKKSIECTFL